MTTKMKNETVQLTNILDSIWKLGDKDECSVKHVWAGIAATVAGTPAWETRADMKAEWAQYVAAGKPAGFEFKPGESPYPTPWGEDGYWPEDQMLKKESQLGANWELVKGLLEEIGHGQFGVAVSGSKFMAGHIESYLEDLNKAGLGNTGDTASFLIGLNN